MAVLVNGPAVSTITGATGGVFKVIPGEPGAGAQATLNVLGSGKLNGQQFHVKASGVASVSAGTYTATVQPLLYASTVAGYTASAAAAIYSAAAINVTVSSASVVNIPWIIDATLEGDSTSGLLVGSVLGLANNGAQQGATAPVAIVNVPTSVNFASEPPLQFAIGTTLGGATTGATSTVALSQWQITAD
jgi:hypothetical protein